MQRWLCENDFINNSEMRTTHTLMTGGVVGVPDGRYDEFLSLYAAEVKSKNKTLSFSELRSDPVFCMYFDIDLLDTCSAGAGVPERISAVIQSVIKRYFIRGDRDDERFRCVVCDTSAKDVTVEGGGAAEARVLVKSGYHITFPNLRVTLSSALQIRYSVVYELEKTMGSRPEGLNARSDVLDKAPYTSGLKMCGSFKRVKCTDCKKTDPEFKEKKRGLLAKIAKVRRKIHSREPGFNYSDLADIHADEFKDSVFGNMYGRYLELTGFNSCRTCLNTGKRMEDRTYMPFLVLDGGGDPDVSLLDILREDYFKVMKYTSTRCQDGEAETPGFAIPKGVPKAPTEENGANMRSFSGNKLTHLGSDMRAFTVNNDIYLSDAKTMHMWKGPPVEDQRMLAVIEKLVRENISGAYASVQIRKVCSTIVTRQVSRRASGGGKVMSALVGAHSGTAPSPPVVNASRRYLVNVAGVGSTYCLNKGAEHTSNSVYFIITSSHCFQRCFSTKSELRKGGTTCSAYRSGGVSLPPSVAAVLFPEEHNKGVAGVTRRPADVSSSGVSVRKSKSKKRRIPTTNWRALKI